MKIYMPIFLFLFAFSSFGQDVNLDITDADQGNNGKVTASVSNSDFIYSFLWTDENGTPISPEPFCSNTTCTLTGLAPGRYCLTVTASGSDCGPDVESTAQGCFDVQGSNCDLPLDISFETSDPACSNTSEGFVTLLYGDESDICWFFHPNQTLWTDGTTTTSLTNLQPGSKHCVTLKTDPDDPTCEDCVAYYCVTVPSLDAEPLQANAWTGDICCMTFIRTDPKTGITWEWISCFNGWIIVNDLVGGFGNISVKWLDNGSTSLQRSIGSPGTYCAEISDECGNKIFKCWTLGRRSGKCLTPYLELGLTEGTVEDQAVRIIEDFPNELLEYSLGSKLTLSKVNNIDSDIHYLVRDNIEEVGTLTFNRRVDPRSTNERSSINVFPNPASENVNIEIKGTQSSEIINIYNSHGTLMKQLNLYSLEKNTISIDVGGWMSGIYLIKCGNTTQKLLIQSQN